MAVERTESKETAHVLHKVKATGHRILASREMVRTIPMIIAAETTGWVM